MQHDHGYEAGQIWMLDQIDQLGSTELDMGTLPAVAMSLMPDTHGAALNPGGDPSDWRDGWYAGVCDILMERKWRAAPA